MSHEPERPGESPSLPCRLASPAGSHPRVRLLAIRRRPGLLSSVLSRAFAKTDKRSAGLRHAPQREGPGLLSVVVVLKTRLLTISEELG